MQSIEELQARVIELLEEKLILIDHVNELIDKNKKLEISL